MAEGLSCLHRIHKAVLTADAGKNIDMMELCRQVADRLGLPPFAVNPLVAKAFASSLAAEKNQRLFAD